MDFNTSMELAFTYFEIGDLRKAKSICTETYKCQIKSNPFISIITPTLSRAEFLEWSIKSFIAQEFLSENYEIIIVDNGSTDSTRQVVETFKTSRSI